MLPAHKMFALAMVQSIVCCIGIFISMSSMLAGTKYR